MNQDVSKGLTILGVVLVLAWTYTHADAAEGITAAGSKGFATAVTAVEPPRS